MDSLLFSTALSHPALSLDGGRVYCVVVCGGRLYADRGALFSRLDELRAECRGRIRIVTGGAKGADELARQWAVARGAEHREHKADWERHGKAAGPIRNQRMLDEEKPDMVLAFPGGKGTSDMVRRAREAGCYVEKIAE